MKARQLAQTDVWLSPLALGTVKFGRNQAVKYPTGFDLPDDKRVRDLLTLAFDQGMTTLDTAPAYGIAEERLGKILPMNRHDVQIIGKAGEHFNSQTTQSQFDFSPNALLTQLKQSLKALKTDYLDCWLLHSDGNDRVNLSDEVIDTFLQAKKAGYVRTVGASTKTIEGGKRALEHFDCVMMASSADYQEEDTLFSIAKEKQKSLLLKKIFNSGWDLQQKDKENVLEHTFSRLFQHVSTCSAVIGTGSPKHLKENIEAFEKAVS